MKRLCPSCNTLFETPYPDHVYCTDTCQRREKGRRRKERRLAGRAADSETFKDDGRYELVCANPTDRQLTELCVDVSEGKYTKPILLTGFLPKDYIKPASVDIVEQPREVNKPMSWCLVKHEASALDMFLRSSPQ